MNRRGLLTIAMVGASATVTAASLLRKPSYPAPEAIRPVAEPVAETVHMQDMAAAMPTAPPKAVPDFAWADGDGRPHRLAEYAGRIVVLNLWATWCAPCVAELPALATLARAGGADIAVLPLSSDRGGAATVRKFLAAHGVDLPVLVDPTGESGRLLGARGLPTTLVIDRQGRERARIEGALDWAAADVGPRIAALAM